MVTGEYLQTREMAWIDLTYAKHFPTLICCSVSGGGGGGLITA